MFVDDFHYQYTDRNEIREVRRGQLKTLADPTPKAAPDGTALPRAWFLDPLSIAASRSGDLSKSANLIDPVSISVDSQNRVWAADYCGYFYSIAQDGTMSKPVLTPVTGGKGLLAVDSKDRVYILGMVSLTRVLADGTVYSSSNSGGAPGF